MVDIKKIRELEQDAEQMLGPLGLIIQQTFQPIWYSHDTRGVSADNVAAVSRSTPPIDAPKPLDKATFDRGRQELSQLLSPEELDRQYSELDDMVHYIILQVIQGNNDYLVAKRAFFDSERNWSNAKEQERNEEIKKEVEAFRSANTWGTVEKSLSSFGLVAAGITGIATGFVALGVSAVAVGSLFAIDQLLEDRGKRVVASWLARNDQESEKAWVNRIQWFCSFTALGLSVATVSPTEAVQAAMAVTQAIAKTTKGVLDWRLDAQKASVMYLDLACRTAQKSVDTLVMEIQEICSTLYQFHENIHHIEEQKRRIIHSLLQFSGN